MKKTILSAAIAAAFASTSSAATVLTDSFSYADGALIGNIPPTGPGLAWNTHSGTTPGQVNVLSNAVIVTGSETEDVNVPFAAAGFAFQTGTVLATFDLTLTALPTSAGTYFAHFKDSTTSAFRGRLFAQTNLAATGFRLAIADTTTTVVQLATDLSLNTTYAIGLSIDSATGRTSFTVNGGAATTATDATSFLPISSFALRQSTGEGTMTIDNLSVDAANPATVVAPEPTTALTLLSGLGMLGLLRRRPARRA